MLIELCRIQRFLQKNSASLQGCQAALMLLTIGSQAHDHTRWPCSQANHSSKWKVEYSSPMTLNVSANKISTQPISHHIIHIFHLHELITWLAHDKGLTFPCTKLSVFYKPPPPIPHWWWRVETWYEWMVFTELTWSQQSKQQPVSQTSPPITTMRGHELKSCGIPVPTADERGSLKFHFQVML